MTEIFNTSKQTELRRTLRNNMTTPERLLWTHLRGNQLLDRRFRRQVSIDRYVVDFYCPRMKLVIEVDGDSHFTPEAKAQDEVRQRYIESLGLQVIRFTNDDVVNHMDGVMQCIMDFIKSLGK